MAEPKWEVVCSEPGVYVVYNTWRMAVPGGWIYRYTDSMVFVPEPTDVAHT